MMSEVFSKAADEMGVKRAFSELVPEEPWEKLSNFFTFLYKMVHKKTELQKGRNANE